MTTCKIHQIYYSPESFAKLDSGFIPLNNSDGPPSVREYWPIRQYFLNNPVKDNDLIGFFSPLFYEKTGLSSKDVYTHIENNPNKDVYLFNPYFHITAWHFNTFTQGEMSHPGIIDITNKAMHMMKIEIDVNNLAMSSKNSVYCNYFVASGSFWKRWLMVAEFIYALSTIDESFIGKSLKEKTTYIKESLPMKVFIIERIASMLLAIPNTWAINAKLIFINMQYRANSPVSFLEKMIVLDSLKSSFIETKNPIYLNTFNHERTLLMNNHSLSV